MLDQGANFCDDEGYDIIPIWMVAVMKDSEAKEKPSTKTPNVLRCAIKDLPNFFKCSSNRSTAARGPTASALRFVSSFPPLKYIFLI